MSAATQLIAVFDVAGWTPEQIGQLELEVAVQATDSEGHPDTTVRTHTTHPDRVPSKEIDMNAAVTHREPTHEERVHFGLDPWQVHDRFKGLVWTGLANGAIHALDQYVATFGGGYASYTELTNELINEDGDCIVYVHGGCVTAVFENTEISAVRDIHAHLVRS